MCIKCEIKKAMLKDAGLEEVKTVVGTIGRGYVKELSQLDAAEEKLTAQIEEEMERRLEEEKAKVFEKLKADLEEKYGKKLNDLEDLQKKVFEDGLAAAGITIELVDKDFTVDMVSGEVVVIEIKPLTEFPAAE